MSGAIEVTEDDNSIVSDNSFVILGQGSFSLEVNDNDPASMNSQQQYQLTNGEHEENGSVNGNSKPNTNSSVPGTSSVGIQLKLEKLVKENLLLKETLNQSNLAMKNQFDTLALWHEEVVKTHESHKQKFQETQDQIFKLRNENMSLKKLIQQNLERCYGNNSALVNLELEGVSPQLERSSKDVNFRYLYIEELRMKNTELERLIHDITQEKLHLENELKKALEENINLKKESESVTDTCSQCQGSKRSTTSDKGFNEPQVKEQSGEEMKLEVPSPEVSIINKLSKSVEAVVMSASKLEFAELKKQFEEQSEISLKNSEKLEKMMQLYDEILAEKEKLKDEVEQSKLKTGELIDKIATLNEELKLKDEQLKCKVDEFEQMKKEMQKLVLDCEEVAILRAQVELYQDDFNEERRAREEAVGEKEKMAEQVRFLERSLSDFQKKDKENEAKGFTSIPKSERSALSYKCPKCMKTLPTLTECESHVEACLELDLFP